MERDITPVKTDPFPGEVSGREVSDQGRSAPQGGHQGPQEASCAGPDTARGTNVGAATEPPDAIGDHSEPLVLSTRLESSVYSQNGEDGIIEALFDKLGTFNMFYVEVGVEDGTQCNTRNLYRQGWTGVCIDDHHDDPPFIYRHTVMPGNIIKLLNKYHVPQKFDFFSIDIDGSDFHVLHALLKEFRPRVICTEYNSCLGEYKDCVQPFVSGYRWDGSNYFGSSYKAFDRLANYHGYKVVYCDRRGINLFMVQSELANQLRFDHPFRPCGYHQHRGDPMGRSYATSKEFLHVMNPELTQEEIRAGCVKVYYPPEDRMLFVQSIEILMMNHLSSIFELTPSEERLLRDKAQRLEMKLIELGR